MLSEHFNLTHPPFSDENDLTGLFSCPDFEDTYDELLLGVLDGRRLQLVVGAPGSGRTTMLARVRIGLEPTEFDVIPVRYADCTLDEFCSLLAADVEALSRRSASDSADFDEADPRQRLADGLEARRREGRPVVFLLDDADRLGGAVLNPLPEVLGRLGAEPLAQAVLAVPPDFVQRLTGIELDQLNAAIDGIMHLAPWDETTTTDYICACVQSCAGVAGQIFTEDAFTEIVTLSAGMPARVNRLCAGAMQVAFDQGKRRVDHTHVRAAFEDVGHPNEALGDPPDSASSNPGDAEDDFPDGDTTPLRAKPAHRKLSTRLSGFFSGIGPALGRLLHGPRQLWDNLRARLGSRAPQSATPTRTMVAGASVLVVATVTGVIFLLNPLGAREKPPQVVTSQPTKSVSNSGSTFRTAVQPLTASATQTAATTRSLAEPSTHSQLASTNSGTPATTSTLVPAGGSEGMTKARSEEHLYQLTEAVKSLSRSLVSVEARMRGFESDVARLTKTVHELQSSPRAMQASAVVPTATTTTPVSQARATVIPAKASAPAPRKVLNARTSTKPEKIEMMAGARESIHVVRRGDTLWGIAKRHGTTVANLTQLNQLDRRAALRQGQRIRIAPANASATKWYVVRKGDSLYSIGKRFAVAPQRLIDWNCLGERKRIFPGQKISLQAPASKACERKHG